MYRTIMLAMVPWIVATPCAAQVQVTIASTYSTLVGAIPPDPRLPGTLVYPIAESGPTDDRYVLSIATKSRFQINVVDDRSLNSSVKWPFLLDREVTGPAVIPLPNASHGAGLVIQSVDGGAPQGTALYRVGSRQQEQLVPLRKYLQALPDALAKVWSLPRFKIELKPCGNANAYSAPDIVICTELFGDLYERGLIDAIVAVEAHEMAHSLLQLWGLPGADNEDIADEFAVVMLGDARPKSIDAYIRYFVGQDSLREAAVQLQAGDRHTISIQRARNMKAAMANLGDIQTRWTNLLAPYVIKATDARPIVAPKSPNLTVVQPSFELGSLNGVCASMSIDRDDRTSNCSGSVIYMRQKSGRHALIFSTVDGSIFSFSGSRFVAGSGGQAYLEITDAAVAYDPASKSIKSRSVTGKCLFTPALEAPDRVICNSVGDEKGTIRSVNFQVTTGWSKK